MGSPTSFVSLARVRFRATVGSMLRRVTWTALLLAALSGCGGSQVSPMQRVLLPHSEAPQVSELEVSRKDTTYPVSGLSAADLRRSMYAHAEATWPDPRAVGLTEASIPIAGRCQEYSDGGALRDATISLSLVVHLPAWQDSERAPPKLRQSWQRFLRALAAHEEGHVEIAIKHAKQLRAELAALTPEESCQAFMTKFQERAARAQARMDEEQAAYDAKTEHGIKQGCVL